METSTHRAEEHPTTAYAIAYLRDVDFGDEIIDYLSRIDAALALFGGRFLVHGGEIDGVPMGYQATDGIAAMLASST